MKYSILAQKHPTYAGREWEEMDDLYAGGYQILRNAARYLPQMIGETNARYEERVRIAAYISYLGQVVDFFVANLFSQELRVTPAADAGDPTTPGGMPDDPTFYTLFARDADRRGTPFPMLMRKALTNALVKGRALIAIDFPRATDAPRNRAEEEALGLSRGYTFEIPIEELYDWEHDDQGALVLAVLRRIVARREELSAQRELKVEEFKVWQRRGNTATWELYRTAAFVESRPPQPNDDVPLVATGETTFREIPIVELVLPSGLWVGNKIGPLAKEHFQRRNILLSAENKSLFAIPYVALGSEVGAPGASLPSEVQQDPNRARDPRIELANKGYLVIGSGDRVGFAEPSGGCYAVVESQLRDLKDELFRVVHQMAASVSNIGASLGRSGDSKEEDRKATSVVLGALGTFVREFATRIYRVLSDARGEHIIWVPSGLDRYDGESRLAVLQEATQLDNIPIPSPTFRKTLKTEVALRLLPNLPPETADLIRKEIQNGVEEDDKRRGDLHAVMADLNRAGSAMEEAPSAIPQGDAARGGEAAPSASPNRTNDGGSLSQ